jgi:tuftelin-interacting protein 11
MARFLRANFRVDPAEQEVYLPILNGAFKWLDIISASTIGEVVVAEVFPMWHDALYQWLLLEDANYEEIGQWFEWWADEALPEEIRSLPSVFVEFEKGAALINAALDLGDEVAALLPPPSKGSALAVDQSLKKEKHHHRHHRHHHHPARPTPSKPDLEEVNFKDIVEDWCQENDLQFIPERKKVHAEGPLYRITARGDGKGGVLVYFKGGKVITETKKGMEEFHADKKADWGYLWELAQ